MFELMKSEFNRYQKWAWLWCLLLLCVFMYIGKFKPLLEPNFGQIALNNLLLIGGSFAFGILQMALHKRKNHWTYLILRPIPVVSTFLALFGAAISILFIAVSLPWLIVTLGIDWFGSYIVDVRHYTYVAFLFLTCVMVLQIGNLIMLNASWGILLIAICIPVVLGSVAKNQLAQFLPVILVNIALFYLNVKSFKADLSSHLQQPTATVLLSIPISFCLAFCLLMSTTIFYHFPKFIMGTHSDTNPQIGTLRYMNELHTKDYLQYVLEGNTSDIAQQMIGQSRLAEHTILPTHFEQFSRKEQLYVDDSKPVLVDSESKVRWQFSHDEMVFVGHSRTTGKSSAVIGKNGFIDTMEAVQTVDRFLEVPFTVDERTYMTSRGLYLLDYENKDIQPRLLLPEDEWFLDPPHVNQRMVSVLTNKRIVLFDSSQYLDEYVELDVLLSLPHPVPPLGTHFVIAYELVDGLTLLYRGNNYFGFEKPAAQVYHATYDGRFTLVGERIFEMYSHPAWIRQFEYMMSPSLFIGRSGLLDLIMEQNGGMLTFEQLKQAKFNPHVVKIAILLQIFSVIGILYFCHLHKLSTSQRITWFVLVGVMSFPAFLSFFLLNPWKNAPYRKTVRKVVLQTSVEPMKG